MQNDFHVFTHLNHEKEKFNFQNLQYFTSCDSLKFPLFYLTTDFKQNMENRFTIKVLLLLDIK